MQLWTLPFTRLVPHDPRGGAQGEVLGKNLQELEAQEAKILVVRTGFISVEWVN